MANREKQIQDYRDVVDGISKLGGEKGAIGKAKDDFDVVLDKMLNSDFPQKDYAYLSDSRMRLFQAMADIKDWLSATAGTDIGELEKQWGLVEGDLDY